MKVIIRILCVLITAAALFGCDASNTGRQSVSPQPASAGAAYASPDETWEANTAQPVKSGEAAQPSEPPALISDTAAPSVNGKLKVNGADLTDKNGNKVQLKGISTHGLAWFPQYVNQECFTQLKEEFGANVVRLAMYTAESGGYCTDGDSGRLKRLVKDGVNYAKNADMYAIVDWHILSDSDPNINKDEAIEFFDEISKEFKDYNNVIYEICNEPNGSTTWEQIASYAGEVIPVIRENDPDAVILVGTPNCSQYIDQAARNPLDFDNIMYTVHYYAATHREDLRERVRAAYNGGLPIFISEYGICDASGNGEIDYEQAELWERLSDELNLSSAMWNLSNKDETSAIIKPDCDKASGFTDEDLSEAGKWFAAMLKGELTVNADNYAEEAESQAEAGKTARGTSDYLTSSNIAVNIETVNSWEEEGETVSQYAVCLENNGEEINGWSINIVFDADFGLKDSWNGNFESDGKSLRIKNADYNGKIARGERISDIGFIISGDVKIVNVN